MKTVGIITYQWYNNYGTVLQAYALQTSLKKIGCNAHIIPIEMRCSCISRYFSKSVRGQMKKVNRIIIERGNKWRSCFDQFRSCYFDYGGMQKMSFEEVLQHCFSEDVLVFGSDNIWSFWCYGLDEPMGQIFTGVGICHPRKVVYAASTGGDIQHHPDLENGLALIREAGFRHVSVREPQNVGILANHGIDAEFVPDPTLLLTESDWSAFEDRSLVPDEPYVLGYDLGHPGNYDFRTVCQEVAAKKAARILMPYPQKWCRDRRFACYPSPRQWLALVHHADVVVTNSYHGVLFSQIFGTRFKFLDIGGTPSSQTLNLRVREILNFIKDDRETGVRKAREIGLDYLRRTIS